MGSTWVLCAANTPRIKSEEAWTNSLSPLRTLCDYITTNNLSLERLIFITASHDDITYCGLAAEEIAQRFPTSRCIPEVHLARDPLSVASVISQQVESAGRSEAELLIDITPGPKDRTAAIYVAASAFPSVRVLYAQREATGYELVQIPPMGDFSRWLARHGIIMRDYRNALLPLRTIPGLQPALASEEHLASAIADLLESSVVSTQIGFGPRTILLHIAEILAKDVAPQEFLGIRRPSIADEDEGIRRVRGAWKQSAARGAQTIRQLRNLLAHAQQSDPQPGPEDALVLLDPLCFLGARLAHSESLNDNVSMTPETMIVAVDGDDIGKRFEERLAQCSNSEDIKQLVVWSRRIQQDLTAQMLLLQESWEALFLARTGDGFLAMIPAGNLATLRDSFRPSLSDASVSTGIGPTVKDAYLGLKLCKAMNRGGGIFYSFDSREEHVLWLP